MPDTGPITSFRGEFSFLSNFYQSPLMYSEAVWRTAEHAYQAAKCLREEDKDTILMACWKPGQAKRFGRRVAMVPDWDVRKVGVMLEIVRAKFSQNRELAEKLLATGERHLEEGNYWGDKFWGTYQTVGENHLGKILMQVRMELREGLLPIHAHQPSSQSEVPLSQD